jgi:nucleoside-diphosphate-sugar epimerase
VLLLGGEGFVGSEVARQLRKRNIPVTTTSTSGRNGSERLDVREPGWRGEYARLLKASGAGAVVSCVGAIGTEDDQEVNAASGIMARDTPKGTRFV